MKIVILGAGALGTVLGAHLARAGEDVTLIARGQRAAYLQEYGGSGPILVISHSGISSSASLFYLLRPHTHL